MLFFNTYSESFILIIIKLILSKYNSRNAYQDSSKIFLDTKKQINQYIGTPHTVTKRNQSVANKHTEEKKTSDIYNTCMFILWWYIIVRLKAGWNEMNMKWTEHHIRGITCLEIRTWTRRKGFRAQIIYEKLTSPVRVTHFRHYTEYYIPGDIMLYGASDFAEYQFEFRISNLMAAICANYD